MEDNYFTSSRNLTDNDSYMNKFRVRKGFKVDDSGNVSSYIRLKKMSRAIDKFLKENTEGKGAQIKSSYASKHNNYQEYKKSRQELQGFTEAEELYFKMDSMPTRDINKCWKVYEKGDISTLYKYVLTYSKNTHTDIDEK